LLFGPYRTPRFRLGKKVFCAVRGWVTICDISSGRIHWPIAKKVRGRSLGVYKDLLNALQRESGIAVCHWWGLTSQTITKWRKALGIGPVTRGTSALRRAHALQPWANQAREKAWAKANDPIRCEKIAASKRGKPRPPEVCRAIGVAQIGKRMTQISRQKMSITHKRRGTRPPKAGPAWSVWEEGLLKRGLTAANVSKATGRTLTAVYSRRYLLRQRDMSPTAK
jgi:hypothetical protein